MKWLLVFLASSCGGIGSGDFTEELLDATCEYYVRCGIFATIADCRTRFDSIVIEDPSIEAAIDEGKLVYDGDAAQSCVDAVSSLACDIGALTGDELAVCDDVFTGALTQGETCGFSGECESDNCVKPSGCTMACCTGTCGPPRTLPGVGQPCTAICVEDAFCGNDSICHALLPAGAACDTYDGCERGLYCAGLSAVSSGTCTALPQLGQSCDVTAGCAQLGLVCTGTCVEAGLPGDACTTRSQCSPSYDCDGSRCVQYPTLGMPCTVTCSDDSWCNQATMKCEAPEANGATCTYNDECATNYCLRNVCSDVALCI